MTRAKAVLDGKIFSLDVLKSMGAHFLGPTLGMRSFVFKILRYGALECKALEKKKKKKKTAIISRPRARVT